MVKPTAYINFVNLAAFAVHLLDLFFNTGVGKWVAHNRRQPKAWCAVLRLGGAVVEMAPSRQNHAGRQNEQYRDTGGLAIG
eukprot:1891017-Pleurochrysis_carterae.AAC.2